MYQLIRPILFSLDPERAHFLSLIILKLAHHLGLTRFFSNKTANPCHLFGLDFPNPIGLAAGIDKDADYIDALASLGFGFIEIGTVTPLPQPGNPKPRLFRLTTHDALINRMGFPSKGMEYVAQRLEKMQYKGIIGINIVKNRETPNERASDDYVALFRRLWPYASYFAINISSPNTPGLRLLHQSDLLNQLLSALKNEQQQLLQMQKKYVPLIVKISPDLTDTELAELATVLLQHRIDGVIVANTSLRRDKVASSIHANEPGGLSGKPLDAQTSHSIAELHAILQDKIPIIASGGIMDAKSANEKLEAGARLLQTYTGFVYNGPGFIKELCKAYSKM